MADRRRDRRELVDLLEAFLLGERPEMTGRQLAAEVGIPYEDARRRWRSLGFSEVGPEVPAFTRADLEALRLTQRLVEIGLIDPDDESALVRTLGRSFARLAEWQMGLLAKLVDVDTMSIDELSEVMTEVTSAVESLQSYAWRRHALAASSRLLLANPGEPEPDPEPEPERESEGGAEFGPESRPEGESAPEDDEDEGVVLGVGVADIVNYTRQSRSLTRSEIARFVDHFEERALAIISSYDGRIIKTIGDEVLFVADDPVSIARIGLELTEERLRDDDFPEIRVGLAWGPALARLGDVLGPVVNVAARLTSTTRPGRVLVDRALAERLGEHESFRLRRLRRTSVRGYRRLEPWSLRRPADEDPEISEDGRLPGPASAFLHQQTLDLKRVVEEMGVRRERPAVREGADQGPGR